MEFGIFALSPQRSPNKAPAEVVAQTVAEARLAEELGFDAVWIAEHHFGNLSLSPSPLLLAGHLAGITQRIAIGTGVLVLPLYQPMRLVEEIAYVDILSGGRLRLGIGTGNQNHESRGLMTHIRDAHDRFVETLDIIEMAFDTGRVDYRGKHFQVPDTPLSVSPTKPGGLPVYLAGLAHDEEIMTRAGRRGYVPFASAAWMPAEAVKAKRAMPAAAYQAAGRDPDAMPFAISRVMFVTEDKAEALKAAEAARYTYRVVKSVKGTAPVFNGPFIRETPFGGEDNLETIAQQAMIGDAEKIAAMIIADIEALGVTHMCCFMNMGGLASAAVQRSMELFAGEVRPLVERQLAVSRGRSRESGHGHPKARLS
jgi:alkanesulfonate monooxygenase SsuD/methylene tetrahydromethanopterin reductase-like flavin-dependent oxidoreductase (luciferase family)